MLYFSFSHCQLPWWEPAFREWYWGKWRRTWARSCSYFKPQSPASSASRPHAAVFITCFIHSDTIRPILWFNIQLAVFIPTRASSTATVSLPSKVHLGQDIKKLSVPELLSFYIKHTSSKILDVSVQLTWHIGERLRRYLGVKQCSTE